MPTELAVLVDLATAIGLGLLVGLQREWVANKVAGIRTFPLISLFGALSGLLATRPDEGGLWLPAAGIIAVALTFWVGRDEAAQDEGQPGLTTKFAGLVMFIVGALVTTGFGGAAVVTSGVVAVLLHWKDPLHGIVDRIGEDDFRAIVRLVIIGMVILPVLPNQAYGPYHVLNPFQIWLMILLIVGISMVTYVVKRMIGAKVGTLLGGVLGGLISSTATTVSYARQSRQTPSASQSCAIVILIASTVVFVRVLVEVALVAPTLFREIATPLSVMAGFMCVVGAITFFVARSAIQTPESEEPPSELKGPILFGILYAAVLLFIALAKEHFDESAMYAVAGLSGLTDMDAITLSTAQLMKSGRLPVETGWRLILIGAMANLVFKTAVIATLGSPKLLWRIAVLFGISLAGGAVLFVFWPG